MPVTLRRRSRIVRASATLTLSGCLVLAATAALAGAAARTKTCAHINGCSASVNSPLTAFTGGRPAPASHLAVAVATAPKSTARARQVSGTLVTAAAAGRRIRCGGYRLKAPTTFQFELNDTTASTASSATLRVRLSITYEITERITDTTADGIQFCLGTESRFRTLSGRPARARRLPDGTSGYVGLLPACPAPLPPPGETSAPCLEPVASVKDANSTTGVDVILKARVPVTIGFATARGAGDTGGGDPWGGG